MISGRYFGILGIVVVASGLSSCRFDEEVWCHDLREIRKEVAQRTVRFDFESRTNRAPASNAPFMPSTGVPYEERLKFEREDGQRWSEGVLKRLDEVRILTENHPQLRASLPAVQNATFEMTIFHGRVSKERLDIKKVRDDLARFDAVLNDVEKRDCPAQ